MDANEHPVASSTPIKYRLLQTKIQTSNLTISNSGGGEGCAIFIPFYLLIFIDLVIFILYVLVFSCSYVCMGVLDALELE